ncbi:hypothetical protein V2177_19905 [Bacillus licheniformis]|uniref:hypothetical protein n=1 Tax=Bacillus TaxID=1386 RepID=UPI00025A9AB3|nr:MULTISPECIES: hypothetical protein [Bacillus]MDP4137038.1 hypothetical protein [Bacillota bacterium]AKQ75290.1 hypothetical protein MUY_004158 [Bacillus licheniformis WX-02]ASV17311.1 hypothetical protein CJO35_19970 [Bacillus sp. 1s-1]AVI47487.1 hypothetical protein BL14DL4_02259 [Bacillus licheniformis]EQM26398.1 hypothetical protein N399_21790 [Bacillus licheniformis CG-B52]
MKGLISFLKLWTAVLLNAVMPVREHQMKVTAFAGGTYQAADAYQAGGFSEKREEKTERMSGCKRMKPGSYTTEPSRAVCKKAVKRVRAGPTLYTGT